MAQYINMNDNDLRDFVINSIKNIDPSKQNSKKNISVLPENIKKFSFIMDNPDENKKENNNSEKNNFFNYPLYKGKGWLLKEEKKSIKMPFKENRIVFIGKKSIGKKYLINKIFNLNLSSENSNSFDFYYLNELSKCIINTPGFLYDKYFNDNEIDKRRDAFILKFSLIISNIIILVINELNEEEFKNIKFIEKLIIDDSKRDNKKKYFYILHNNSKLIDINEYNNYINNTFNNEIFKNNYNLRYSQQVKYNNFEIIHFVPKPFLESFEDNIIENLIFQIDTGNSVLLNQRKEFNELINDNLKLLTNSIYQNYNKNTFNLIPKIENDKIYIGKEDEKNEFEFLKEDELNILISNNNFDENFFYASFNSLEPDFCNYILQVDENKKLFVIEIEICNLDKNNFELKKNQFKTDGKIQFNFKGKKNELNSKDYIKTNRNSDEINFEFIVSFDNVVNLEDNYNYEYKNGVLKIEYEYNEEKDDDSVVKLEEEEEEEDDQKENDDDKKSDEDEESDKNDDDNDDEEHDKNDKKSEENEDDNKADDEHEEHDENSDDKKDDENSDDKKDDENSDDKDDENNEESDKNDNDSNED